MPALIKAAEIRWLDPVSINFGFSGLEEKHAKSIMRDIVRDAWPTSKRPKQCVYIIRLTGPVAVDYPIRFSPLVYIGEGNAFGRIYGHTNWLTPLVLSVPQLGIAVHVAEVARKNHSTLYQYLEADMIRWFQEEHGALPWFNLQRERSKENRYEYEHEAVKSLSQHLGVGSGNKFLWAIKPTKNNDQFDAYDRGHAANGGK